MQGALARQACPNKDNQPKKVTTHKQLAQGSKTVVYRPTGPVDGVKARGVFVGVVEAAGCAGVRTVKLEFLRGVDYDTLFERV